MAEEAVIAEQANPETPAETAGTTSPATHPEVQTEKPDAKAEATEVYAFTFPEGSAVNEAVTGEFTTLAKDMGINPANAQKLVDFYAKVQAQAYESVNKQWVDAFAADKEFGGPNAEKTIELANRTMAKYSTPEERAAFLQTGLANHPTLVKFFARVGKAMAEDQGVQGNATTAAVIDTASQFYPSMQKH